MWGKSRFTITAVAAISFFINGWISSAPAYADLGDQLAKFLPDDGAVDDLFGHPVAISGTTAIIGAHRDDDNANNTGSAYLFDTTTGQQIAKLLAADAAEGDFFGFSVAIMGDTAIVGAHRDDDNGNRSGSAYLFDISDPNNPIQIAKLLPNDGAQFDQFGWSVAISGATAIVGANGDADNGLNSGSAYLFDISDPENPVQVAKLLPKDGEASDRFGSSLALDGTFAIVGAPYDADNGLNSGSAYVFDISDPDHPLQVAKLLPNDGAADDYFAWSVAINGDNAFVGAYHDDDNGLNSGSAYIFDSNTGLQIAKFLSNDGAAGDDFAWSIAISGTTAIFGAPHDDDNGSNSGSAYLFDISDPKHPVQIVKILPNDGALKDNFGVSVAINGSTAIVGAYWDDDNGSNSGSAYLFAADINTCTWDLNKSGSVGTSDLLELFAQWGTNGPADFDGSGAVGTADLLILFANWGPCP